MTTLAPLSRSGRQGPVLARGHRELSLLPDRILGDVAAAPGFRMQIIPRAVELEGDIHHLGVKLGAAVFGQLADDGKHPGRRR